MVRWYPRRAARGTMARFMGPMFLSIRERVEEVIRKMAAEGPAIGGILLRVVRRRLRGGAMDPGIGRPSMICCDRDAALRTLYAGAESIYICAIAVGW